MTLEGPGAFSVDSANGGKLHQGKLTVRTPKAGDHPLFCVRSRTGVVTERGNCGFGLDIARSAQAMSMFFEAMWSTTRPSGGPSRKSSSWATVIGSSRRAPSTGNLGSILLGEGNCLKSS